MLHSVQIVVGVLLICTSLLETISDANAAHLFRVHVQDCSSLAPGPWQAGELLLHLVREQKIEQTPENLSKRGDESKGVECAPP
jgi:hypothetical protein